MRLCCIIPMCITLFIILISLPFPQATLWSKVFKYELELGHNQEAYNAMLANPDSSRY